MYFGRRPRTLERVYFVDTDLHIVIKRYNAVLHQSSKFLSLFFLLAISASALYIKAARSSLSLSLRTLP